jgi:hypothetical protein
VVAGMTPEEALGRLSGAAESLDGVWGGDPEVTRHDVEILRQALGQLAWYRREYPIAHRVATEVREQVADLRWAWDRHDRRCRWGGRP